MKQNEQLYYFIYETPFAAFYVFSDEKNLRYASFANEVTPALLNEATLAPDRPVLRAAKRWLDFYFAGEEKPFDLPYVIKGTVFQQTVWDLLLTIRFGELVTYGNLSQEVARKRKKERMSAQAVGQAVGQNPLSLFIPCHRVVAANNKIGGYGGGISIKKELLRLEGYNIKEDKYDE